MAAEEVEESSKVNDGDGGGKWTSKNLLTEEEIQKMGISETEAVNFQRHKFREATALDQWIEVKPVFFLLFFNFFSVVPETDKNKIDVVQLQSQQV